MQRDKTLVFDLGGVLIKSTGRESLTGMLHEGIQPRDVPLRWLASPLVQQFERGHVSAQEFASAFVEEWNLSVDGALFIESFATWMKGFFPGAKELLTSLRMQHRIVCLSNSNEVHWGRFPELATLFDMAFASHQMGLVKPDREAFEYVIARTNTKPADIYFFDDMLPNVETARSRGMRAFQVEGLAALKAALRGEMLYADTDA